MWRVVYFPHIFIRAGPSFSAAKLASIAAGACVSIRFVQSDHWARLEHAEEQWVLTDGTAIGLPQELLVPFPERDRAAVNAALEHLASGRQLALAGQITAAASRLDDGLSCIDELDPVLRERETTDLFLEKIRAFAHAIALDRRQHSGGAGVDIGGDTGSDCVGTSNRHGAASVTQFEVMPQPPEQENKPLVWPYWPLKLRTSSSHEEGCVREFAISTQQFIGKDGKVTGLKTVQVEMRDGKLSEVAGTEQEYKADLVLLAMGFVNPLASLLEAFGVEKDGRGNAKASTDFTGGYATNVKKVFAAGDVRRGQSLVVWAIREGRQAARAVDEFLMGQSDLPR